MRSWGGPPTGENAKLPELRDVEVIEIEDPVAEQHWLLLQHHPGFQAALVGLREELDYVYREPSPADFLDDIVANPQSAPYPLLKAAEEWGLSPIDLLGLVFETSDEWSEHFRPQANGIFIWETPGEFVIRVPRPITPEKRQQLDSWLKNAPDGQLERAHDLIGKQRHDLSPALIEALPWFERWNAGETLPTIWHDVRKGDKPSWDAFHGQVVRAWERMRSLSPTGIRENRPSRAPA
jgi:hypothetical protein